MKKRGKIISFTSMAVIGALAIIVNVFTLGVFKQQLQDFVFGYDYDKSANQQNRETGEALAKTIEEEGIVMVKNDNMTLPLDKDIDNKVNVFGWSSSFWIPGGSGSGRVVDSSSGNSFKAKTGLIEALNKSGISTNTALTSFYKSFASNRPGYDSGTLNTYDYQFHRIIEPDISSYPSSLLNDAKSFSDTAFVVLGRMSGESSDAPKVQYKGNGSSATPDDASKTYLEASNEELTLLNYVASNYENVVVIINSTNAFNLSFLDEIDGLDSCLIVGGTGINAADGIASILYGEANPSGRLTDTLPYDFRTNATYTNSGSDGINEYTNGNGLYPADGSTTNPNVGNNPKYSGVSYLDYVEGIYVGYKWYETADAEGYWDSINNDFGSGYDGVVQFPFGFGLSYTEFSWDIITLNKHNNSEIHKNDDISVTVRVTNIGSVPGKDVVELYFTTPYYEDGIEKSAINLAAFAKTALLEPGTYEDVTLTFKVEDMASYDYSDANDNDHTGYELEKGNYQIKLMSDAHNLKTLTPSIDSDTHNPIITYRVSSDIYYDTDSTSGNPVFNRFTNESSFDGVSIDGEDNNSNITYLKRSDFVGTFPHALAAAREIDNRSRAINLYTSSMANADNDPSDVAPIFGANYGHRVFQNGRLTELGMILVEEPDAPEWEEVLDQLTETELRNLTLHGYIQTRELNSVGKPRHRAVDGPSQIGSFNVTDAGTGFPHATVVGQTWSTKLAYDFGLALGAESKTFGYDGWYGPGINIHRSPFGGRNYEYYSEDSLLTGKMAASAVKGAKNQGVYCFLKHLICYEQESMRDGIYTWLSEQALREIYLKPFKICIDEGGASGIMTSYNRIGATWAGGHKALITGVLREEWDFKGMVLSDYADHQKYMHGDQALRAGADIWMDGFNNNGTYKFDTTSATFKKHLRRAGRDVLYGWLDTLYTQLMYDPSEDDIEVIIGRQGKPKTWWIATIITVDVVIGLGIASWTGLIIASDLKKKKLAN